jgi:hypothetical protein
VVNTHSQETRKSLFSGERCGRRHARRRGFAEKNSSVAKRFIRAAFEGIRSGILETWKFPAKFVFP